jgi:ribose 5-phosphate isomerase B
MNISIASDHAGYELKTQIFEFLKNTDYSIQDLGPHDTSSVDYPDYADVVCQKLKSAPLDFGILICGSGQGMALRANKYSHIRAALVYSEEIAQLSREHNNANVICLGSRFCNLENAQNWINIFLNTNFSEGRHALRVAKVSTPINNN